MRYILALVIGTSCVSICSAVPIRFTHEGSGSGTLNGTPFGNASFVISAQGDTTNRQFLDFSSVYFIDHDTAEINLSGLGTFAFTSGTRTFVNQGNSLVGFSRAGPNGSDLFNGPQHALYSSWDMLTSIGPHSGIGSLLQWQAFGSTPSVTTSGGILIFDSPDSQATFTATIPEPSAAVLSLIAAIFSMFRSRCF